MVRITEIGYQKISWYYKILVGVNQTQTPNPCIEFNLTLASNSYGGLNHIDEETKTFTFFQENYAVISKINQSNQDLMKLIRDYGQIDGFMNFRLIKAMFSKKGVKEFVL